MSDERDEERWIRKMVELEEERGPIVPEGAQGKPRGRASAAVERARSRVRLGAQAVGRKPA